MPAFFLPRPLAAGLVALPLILAAAAPAFTQEDDVVATVDGTPISYSDLALAERRIGGEIASLVLPYPVW